MKMGIKVYWLILEAVICYETLPEIVIRCPTAERIGLVTAVDGFAKELLLFMFLVKLSRPHTTSPQMVV